MPYQIERKQQKAISARADGLLCNYRNAIAGANVPKISRLCLIRPNERNLPAAAQRAFRDEQAGKRKDGAEQ